MQRNSSCPCYSECLSNAALANDQLICVDCPFHDEKTPLRVDDMRPYYRLLQAIFDVDGSHVPGNTVHAAGKNSASRSTQLL